MSVDLNSIFQKKKEEQKKIIFRIRFIFALWNYSIEVHLANI